VISGNNQTGVVGMPLAAPMVVQLMNGSVPAPNIPVVFKVTENDGTSAVWEQQAALDHGQYRRPGTGASYVDHGTPLGRGE